MNLKEKWQQCPHSQCAEKLIRCKLWLLETWGMSVVNLYVRLWVAFVFWKSAATKVIGAGEVTIFGLNIPTIPLPYEMQSFTYDLFEYEYGLPAWMAPLATFAEVLLPIMLVLGFGGRIAALGLFIMTIVIELTYQHSSSHIIWMMTTAVILTSGPGKFSIDHLIRKNILGTGHVCKKD